MSVATYRPAVPITPQHDAFPQIITALSFDPVSDTLWAGENTGNVTVYYTLRGVRGVSFPVGGSLAVSKVVADETQVRALVRVRATLSFARCCAQSQRPPGVFVPHQKHS